MAMSWGRGFFCWVPHIPITIQICVHMIPWIALEFGLQWVTTCLTRTDAKCHMFTLW